jgi:Domain of unknown function (DUF4279)
MSDYEFTMSLRIRHPSVEPAEITRILGLEPQHTWRAGDTRRDASGDQLGGSYRESYWIARLMAEPELSSSGVGVETELTRTVAHLRKSFEFLQGLRAEGGEVELLVSLFARQDFRLELEPDSLAVLARLGVTVALEVKPHPSGVDAIVPL